MTLQSCATKLTMENYYHIWAGAAKSSFSNLELLSWHNICLAMSTGLNHSHYFFIPLVRKMFHSESLFPRTATFGTESYMDASSNVTILTTNPRFEEVIYLPYPFNLHITHSSFSNALPWVSPGPCIKWTTVLKKFPHVI